MMKRRLFFGIIGLLLSFTAGAQEAVFVPNEGQWDGDFQYKAPLKYGALFLKRAPFKWS
jgi:hypothetical protein